MEAVEALRRELQDLPDGTPLNVELQKVITESTDKAIQMPRRASHRRTRSTMMRCFAAIGAPSLFESPNAPEQTKSTDKAIQNSSLLTHERW